MTRYILKNGDYRIGEYLDDGSFVVKKVGCGATRIKINPSSGVCPADKNDIDLEKVFHQVDRATAKKSNPNL